MPKATSRTTGYARCGRADAPGAPKFLDEEMEERTKEPGVAIGLAWTPVGGDVLFIEASRMAGTGTLTLTGQLGDVMKESARARAVVAAHARANTGLIPTSSRRPNCTCTCQRAIPRMVRQLV